MSEAVEPSSEKDRYKLPEWIARPPPGTHLDVIKSKSLLQKLLIDEKGHYYFGRNPTMCDFVVEHASCSRVHAVLLYHKLLNRFAIVDLGSSHGTFVENVRIEPLTPVFIDFDGIFHFGASTRKYSPRKNLSVRDHLKEEEDVDNVVLPHQELELDNLTEYNTAQNRRIPQIPITLEEARRKLRPRSKLRFAEEEDIINPEDVDPTVGRFRNLVKTAVIPVASSKRASTRQADELFEFYAPDTKKRSIMHHRTADDDASAAALPSIGGLYCSTLGGITLDAAPNLDLYASVKNIPSGQAAAMRGSATLTASTHHGPQQAPAGDADSEAAENHPHKKKYLKEAWPGRKPGPSATVK